jgi:hypothetical protein
MQENSMIFIIYYYIPELDVQIHLNLKQSILKITI